MTGAPILIVGGGLAGLSLGQGLKQIGMPFRIFERDEAASLRAQGYRIRIDQNGGAGLRRLLPVDLFEKFEATSAEVKPGIHRLDAMTGKSAATDLSRMPPKTGAAWNADRRVLRNVLLEGLEPYIEFGKKFDKYELEETGVVAWFADGSSATGSMIVGTDGVNSQVRRHMLPNHKLLDTEGRAVSGRTLVDANTFQHIPAAIGNGICLIGNEKQPRMKLFCDVMRFKSETAADVPQDYIYWVLLFHKSCVNKSDAELFSMTNSQSAEWAEVLTSDWHEKIRAIIQQQVPEAASTLHFSMTKPPIEPWKTDLRVTVIADAAHPMPPVGGVGANLAFEDAAGLLDVIRNGQEQESLAEFEQLLRDRSNKALMQSAGGASHFFGMGPVDSLKPVAP
ncbi:hypothetical protein LTR70_003109 [Exophiala xenobiotica]|uniref:FAD-binding domain-containing protein n=1 Tax=Lithohypha guttulata TaxID=1690604 RepID=A0ABR0KI70_9EURO|nr:hypothetical protein LTR24_002658 [Lithohypha guttulata]KAK5323820.1 hypothetical protein LTR70_003109 [Exophiala xenobiotica]